MMFFLAFTVLLTGCGEQGLKDNPALEATVTSNGGMSVIKGDYLYFVNGYVSASDLTKDDNKAGKVTKGAIYRTKLTDTYNEISKDKDGFLTNADRVVSKVVGFGNGGFQIIDNNIFYATPYMKLSSDGTLQTSRVEFHRVNIDGTNDEVIFVTSGTLSEWTIYKIGNTPYLVVYENSKIVSINASTGKTVGTVENSTSYAIYKDTEYVYGDSRTSFTQTNIIYTRDLDSSLDNITDYKGNVVCSFNIATGNTEVLERGNNTYTIKHATDDTVYYTYTNTGKTIACLYKKVLNADWQNATETQLTNVEYTAYNFVDYGNDLIVATDDNGNYLLSGDANTPRLTISNSSKTILAVYGDYAYYADDNKLFRMYIHEARDFENAYEENKSYVITDSSFIDFDNRRVYCYASYTAESDDSTNYYLNYFEEIFPDGEIEQRFVGVFEANDLPALPEQPEAEYEGDEVEYVPHID